ncbi:tbc Rab GTPase activating domain containing protein [Entamoeba histolytica]|nr:tbc Rab GTPase activating domain containing protein [Entamoeba histolytica]
MSNPITTPQTPIKSSSSLLLNRNTSSLTMSSNQPLILVNPFINETKFKETVEIIVKSKLIEGCLSLNTLTGHVYLQFQSAIQSDAIGGTPQKKKNPLYYFNFCIEDTPSYNIVKRITETEVRFHPGRQLNIQLYPIIFKRDSFISFCEVLKSANVIMNDGFIRTEKKRIPYEVDVEKYISQLQYDEQLIKRNSWIKQIRADCTEKITQETRWDKMNQTNVRKALFYRGTNEECRCDIWKKCLGYNFEEEKYSKLAKQVALTMDIQVNQNKKLSTCWKQIENDIGRTHISTACSKNWNLSKKEIKSIVERLLKCWTLYNFDGGYQQGMSDILIGLMEYSKLEYETFGLFIKVMEMMSLVYLKNEKTDIYMSPIIKVIDPDFHGYLKMVGISYSFMYKWIILLFRRDFPHMACVRLWDAIFAYPENKLYFFIAASLLIQHKEIIMKHRFELDDISIFFQKMENKFDDNIYIDADIAVSSFRVNASDEEQLLVFG